MGHGVAKAVGALIGRGVAKRAREINSAVGTAAGAGVGASAYRENLDRELLTDEKAYGETMAKAVKARKPELTRNNQEALAEHFTDIANLSVDIGGTLRPRVERFRNRVERTPSPWNKERLNASEKRLDAATRKLENTITYARNLGATKDQIKHASKYLDI